jgi:hypothetical protein
MNDTPDMPERSARDRPRTQRSAGMVARFGSVIGTALGLLVAHDTLAYDNVAGGFRDMPWGTPLAAVQSQMRAVNPNLALCKSDCDGELHRRQLEFSPTK